jgi:L-cysteine/cystine lyase
LRAAEVAAIRADLPVLETGGRYLNAGTLGPLPRRTIDAMDAELQYDITRRQSVDLWDRLVATGDRARRALARIVSVDAQQIALMHSTHEGINAALWGIDWRDGDELVTTDQEHPAAQVPMRHVRDRAGVTLRTVAWDGSDGDEELTARVAAACSERTRAVLISHVSWLSGAVAPLRALRQALPEHVRLIVDGAQGGGIVATSLDDGWDAYTISGQKWPCGPNGTGALALADPEAWLPTFGGATQVDMPARPFDSDVVRSAQRFETSQTAMVPLEGVSAAIGWLLDRVDVPRAAAHARAMNTYARSAIEAQLAGAPIRRLYGDAHLLAIELDAESAAPIVRALWDADIQVSAPIAQRRVRFSFGPWTTSDDVDAGIDALAAALR